jgi:hypothetical protein
MKKQFLLFCCLFFSCVKPMLQQQYNQVSFELMTLLSRVNKIDPNSREAKDFMARARVLGDVKNWLGCKMFAKDTRLDGG